MGKPGGHRPRYSIQGLEKTLFSTLLRPARRPLNRSRTGFGVLVSTRGRRRKCLVHGDLSIGLGATSVAADA